MKTDGRGGSVNEPNRAADGRYIVRQTGKETSVSLETVKMVEGLAGPELRRSILSEHTV